jgi:excisionase family DNA binding protein
MSNLSDKSGRATNAAVSGPAKRASDLAEIGTGAPPRPSQLSEVRFLTVAEVAAVMRVSKMTVYRIVHAGELPAVRVGRSFRVPEKAVHDYLEAAYIETA